MKLRIRHAAVLRYFVGLGWRWADRRSYPWVTLRPPADLEFVE